MINSRILLTGATGNLGSALKEKLPEDTIYLTRKPSGNLQEIQGDITLPLWGINWDSIQVGKIIHCAADVNVRKPLSALIPTNVTSTEVLILALKKGIHVDYFSTLSVFASSNITRQDTVCKPDKTLSNIAGLQHYGGYAQSKTLAEKKLIEAAAAYKGNLRILRPSLLIGSNTKDFFYQFHAAIQTLGCIPENIPHEEVNYLSTKEAIEQYFQLPRHQEKLEIHHICANKNIKLQEILAKRGLRQDQQLFLERLETLPKIQRQIIKNAFFKPQPISYHAYDIFHSTGLRFK